MIVVYCEEQTIVLTKCGSGVHIPDDKQLLPVLLVNGADYHPENKLFPEGNNSLREVIICTIHQQDRQLLCCYTERFIGPTRGKIVGQDQS